MAPRLRTLAVIAVGLALLAQTWLWTDRAGVPVGYNLDLIRVWPFAEGDVLVPAIWPEPGPGPFVIKSGPDGFEAEWSLALGGSVRVVERLAPHAVLVGPGPSADDVATTAGNRARWKQSKAPDGANALHATIGHVFISIEGPLSYDKLFDIARSLRPGFPSSLML